MLLSGPRDHSRDFAAQHEVQLGLRGQCYHRALQDHIYINYHKVVHLHKVITPQWQCMETLHYFKHHGTSGFLNVSKRQPKKTISCVLTAHLATP